jgi:asparagine synthase (glutamine-hydrolysing)
MQVGFTVVCRGGDVEFRLHGDSPLVNWSRAGDCTAVLMGRLHYRRDLESTLGPATSEEADGDAGLALRAYLRHGPQGLERLEGDFSLALWDARAQRVFAVRDPMGAFPLWWAEAGEAVVLGTGLWQLLRFLPRADLDPEYLADYLLVCGSLSELATERTVYRGVRRLAPGGLLEVRPDRNRVERRLYWDWREHLEDPGSGRLEERGERLKDLLTAAVRERLHGPVAAHVSGGMDSTALALLARRLMAAGAAPGPLHAVSLVYERLAGLGRERPFTELVYNEYPDLVPHHIAADELLDFDCFADPPPHEEPYPGLWRLGMDRATVGAALGAGAATLLTGIGGDELLDVQPFHLTDLLRRGRLRAAWREATRWARAYNCSVWQVLYPFGVANVFPAWSRLGPGRLLHPRNGLSLANDWLLPPWVRPEFVGRHGVLARARADARRTYASCRPTTLSFALSVLRSRAGNAVGWSLASPGGMVITHPFLDPRVVRFGLGIQAHLPPQPGRLKPVLAEAMRDVLPAAILQRRSKGHFNEIYYLGLSRNLPALEDLIRKSPCDELGLVDRDSLIDGVRRAALGGSGVRPLRHLNLMLGLLKWLQMRGQWERRADEPSTVLRPRDTHTTGRDRRIRSACGV